MCSALMTVQFLSATLPNAEAPKPEKKEATHLTSGLHDMRIAMCTSLAIPAASNAWQFSATWQVSCSKLWHQPPNPRTAAHNLPLIITGAIAQMVLMQSLLCLWLLAESVGLASFAPVMCGEVLKDLLKRAELPDPLFIFEEDALPERQA